MIQSEFDNINISGIMTAVPPKREIIKDKYGPIFGKEAVQQFSKGTGVIERYVAGEKQTAADLAYVAARELLKEKEVEKKDVGILVFVTQSPDYKIPATACVLHRRLGLSKDCMAFDVNMGCSGYVYGMQIICSLINMMNIKYGLLLVGDTLNKCISPEDKSSVMLFGDGGSATLLKKQKSTEAIKTSYRTDGEGYKAIIIPAGGDRNTKISNERTMWGDGNIRSDYELYMNGVDVFSFSISEVPDIINEFFEKQGENKDSYDSFIFHQANCYDCSVSETLLDNIPFDDCASIVLLTEKEQSNQEAVRTDLKFENQKNARINQVVYERSKMDIVLDNWSASFLEKGLPVEMLSPNYLSNSVIWLLSKDSKYISGSVINITDGKQ